jgi:hypothetical protein
MGGADVSAAAGVTGSPRPCRAAHPDRLTSSIKGEQNWLLADYVNYDKHREEIGNLNGRRYPEHKHFSPEKLREVYGVRNANAHAYVSAIIERENVPGLARTLGTAREWQSWLSDKWKGEDNTKVHLRDEWNNDIGRQIGRYAKEHNLVEPRCWNWWTMPGGMAISFGRSAMRR